MRLALNLTVQLVDGVLADPQGSADVGQRALTAHLSDGDPAESGEVTRLPLDSLASLLGEQRNALWPAVRLRPTGGARSCGPKQLQRVIRERMARRSDSV